MSKRSPDQLPAFWDQIDAETLYPALERFDWLRKNKDLEERLEISGYSPKTAVK